jgi:hypothetical protein
MTVTEISPSVVAADGVHGLVCYMAAIVGMNI